MALVETALDLVKLIDPADLETIRKLFYGRKVTLDFLSRTIQTFVPRSYTGNQVSLEGISKALIDLFEELDTDLDGFVTWYDFIGFYSEVSSAHLDVEQHKDFTDKSIFQSLMRTATGVSGKTSLVSVESAIPNNAELTDVKGSIILNMYIIGDAYYLVTDLGVYMADSQFMYPRLIFEPKASVLAGNPEELFKVQLDQRAQERLEAKAYKRLESMGIDANAVREQSLLSAVPDAAPTSRRAILQDMQNKRITSSSTITCSVRMSPLPLIVLCTREPLFIVFSLTGNMAISDPFRLQSPGTCLFWHGARSRLYIGHASGNVSIYALAYERDPDAPQFAGGINLSEDPSNTGNSRQPSLASTTVDAAMQILGKGRSFDSLTREELLKVYPELRSSLIDVSKSTAEALQRSSQEKERLRGKSKQLIAMASEDLEVVSLITSQIFDAGQSTLLSHGIKETQLIADDPLAFVKATVAPDPVAAATHEKRHGGVHLTIRAEFVTTKYVVAGSVRCMDAGRGQWEEAVADGLFRLAVVGSDAALVILDEDLGVVCTFSDLHPEGIMRCYVVSDHITTIGFSNVYQIGPEAVRSCHLGMAVTKEELEDDPARMDGEDDRRGKRRREAVQVSDKKLVKANLVKSAHLITLVQPPRPGKPILASFAFGNVVGVIDHDNVVTLIHALTGAHITRIDIAINLHGVKVGTGVYSRKHDFGYIPFGRRLFVLKVVANEELAKEQVVWDFEDAKREEEQRALGKRRPKELIKHAPEHLPLGSISKECAGVVVNQRMNELGAVTGPGEVTIFSLLTGRPSRIYDIARISKTLLEGRDGTGSGGNDAQDSVLGSEYASIETCDLSKFYAEGQSEVTEADLHFSTPDDEARYRTLHRPPQILSQIPSASDAPQSLLDALGRRILSLAVDSKGRVLYVIGTHGAVTLYWKTGSLFDISNVGITGRRTCEDDIDIVDNPFDGQRLGDAQREPSAGADSHMSSGASSYSLGLNLSQIIVKANNAAFVRQLLSDKSIMRAQILATDRARGLLFLCDNLNPQIVRAIDMKPSHEYVNKIGLSRQLATFDIFFAGGADHFARARQQLAAFFSSKPVFVGADDLSSKPEVVRRFCPEFLWARDVSSAGQPNQAPSPIQKLLCDVLYTGHAKKARSDSYVTCIDASEELSLLAIGTSDGRIFVHDTMSVKLLQQGVIQPPTIPSVGSPITALCFLGQWPLLFSASASGICYIHAVRPLYPNFSLVCAFYHGSYHPLGYPLNADFQAGWVQTAGFLKHALLPLSDFNSDVQLYGSRYEDVVRYLIENFSPDLLHTKYCPERKGPAPRDEALRSIDGEFRINRLLSTKTAYGARVGDLQASTATPSMDASMTTDREGEAASGMIQPPSVFERHTVSNRYAYIMVQESTAATEEGQSLCHLQQETVGVQDDLEERSERAHTRMPGPSYQEIVSATMALLRRYVPISQNFRGLQARRRRTLMKIRAAAQVIMLASFYFTRFLAAPRRVYVDFLPVPLGTSQPRQTASRRKVPQGAVKLSDKSSKVIEDFSKSRFKTSGVDVESPAAAQYADTHASLYGTMMGSSVTRPGMEDVEAEENGILYQYVFRDRTKVRVPVRKESVLALSARTMPTAVCFVDGAHSILVGDDAGFVTLYKIQNLIAALGITRNLDTQQLPKGLLHTPSSGKTSPIVPSSYLRVRYVHRAHAAPISLLSPAGSNSQAYISIGGDKRVALWGLDGAQLLGIVQRVNLDPPPKGWDSLFGVPLTARSGQKSSESGLTDTARLSIEDLEEVPSQVFQEPPPPMRLEAPPACAYPWTYAPESSAGDRVDTVILQSMQQTGTLGNSVEEADLLGVTRQLLASRRPVIAPTPQGDPGTLLKATGLTGRLLERKGDSWTVRAMKLRAAQQPLGRSAGPQ
ncbi:Hypothetical protein DHA2_113673 [Giardia duodenalis]|uniref:EF-hand domain-containing protein n=1 Tax=Giardia intestinalis TaxID=5741 RepID=V6T954_GIAIN|nr:Hypothetical protein DHA2_113673 [Giardia intestinalis]